MKHIDRASGHREIAAQFSILALATAIGAMLLLKGDAIVFRSIAHLFYEQSALASLREPSQLALVRFHSILLVFLLLPIGATWRILSPHARTFSLVIVLAYAVRAAIWIAGSNLPLVPGDSCHYVEVASSILDGEGPVKHYVESFFADYPRIREGKGVLDDWATPLDSYMLAGAYRACGVRPGDSLEATFAVAKGLSFALNMLTLPIVYFFARRRFDARTALVAMAVLAILPVHALYAGFELRESLVTLMSVVAVGTLAEVWATSGSSRYGWAIASGVFTGLAILSRNTAMAMAAACGLYGLCVHRARHVAPMLLWGLAAGVVIAPWAYVTWREYGEPFHTYTKYFPYNFSWTVHHYAKGNTRADQFYTRANAPAIVRVKIKSALIIAAYSTMIVSLPLMAGFLRRLRRGSTEADRAVGWVAVAFIVGTLANVADVTQVQQLGRYYVPLFVLMVPPAVAGLREWVEVDRCRRLMAASLIALLWADPSWAYDYSWLTKNYQLRWPALRAAGDWVRSHPKEVPESSRIMTWFPWEFRLASRRTTILMNRSLFPDHIRDTIRNYGVTHVLWGSFEPPDIDPEMYGPGLARTRVALGLPPADAIYRTPDSRPPEPYPVALHRLGGDGP